MKKTNNLFDWYTPKNKYTLTSEEKAMFSSLEESAFFRKKLTKFQWNLLAKLRTKHLMNLGDNPKNWNVYGRRLTEKRQK
jgi:hypothetical protein